jgi:hypothetical protein
VLLDYPSTLRGRDHLLMFDPPGRFVFHSLTSSITDVHPTRGIEWDLTSCPESNIG